MAKTDTTGAAATLGVEDARDTGAGATPDPNGPGQIPDAPEDGVLSDREGALIEAAIAAANDTGLGDLEPATAKDELGAIYAREIDNRVIKREATVYRRAFLERARVLITRAFDKMRDEVEIANPNAGLSVTARQLALAETVRASLEAGGVAPEIIEQTIATMAKTAGGLSDEQKRRKQEARERYNATHAEEIQARNEARRAAAKAARGGS